jgi:hypothetical protein
MVEPQPFQGFSEPNPFSVNNFIRQDLYFDHSVTSADVRLSVGEELSGLQE